MKFVKIIIVLTMVVFGFVCISKLYATDKQSYPIKIDEVLSNKEDLNPAYSVREDVALKGTIIPVGGGKDSNVTLDLLKDSIDDNLAFVIGSKKVSMECANLAGFDNDKIIEVSKLG